MTDTSAEAVAGMVERLREPRHHRESECGRMEPYCHLSVQEHRSAADLLTALAEENKRLRELSNLSSAMWSDAEAEVKAIEARAEAAEAKAAKLRDEAVEVVRPFAAAAPYMYKCKDNRPLWAALDAGWSKRDEVQLTVAHLRRAAAFLAKHKEPNPLDKEPSR